MKAFKNRMMAALAVFLALAPAARIARAEEPLLAASNIKACFVDLQEVLRNFQQYSKAKTSLEEWAKPKQNMISEKERELQKLDSALKKGLLRSEDAQKEKETEYRKQLADYQDMVKQLQGELSDKDEELLAPIKEHLSKTIEEICKAKGFNLVFDAASQAGRPILYLDDSLDLTQTVIEKVKSMAAEKPTAPTAPPDKPADKK